MTEIDDFFMAGNCTTFSITERLVREELKELSDNEAKLERLTPITCDHCGKEVERWKACECSEPMKKKKIHWGLLPSVLINIFVMIAFKPKPQFSIFGVNWLSALALIVCLILMFSDYLRDKQ